MTDYPDELVDPVRFYGSVSDVIRTAWAFLRALADDDEAATSELLLDAAKDALEQVERAAQCRRALGLTRAACGGLADALRAQTRQGLSFWPREDGNGGRLTIPLEDRAIEIYVMRDAGDWRVAPSPDASPSERPWTGIDLSVPVDFGPE